MIQIGKKYNGRFKFKHLTMLDVNGHMLIKHIVKSDFFKKIYVQLVRVIA